MRTGWKLAPVICLASATLLAQPSVSSAALTFGSDLSQVPGPGDKCDGCAALTLKNTGGSEASASPVNGILIAARVRTRYEGGIGTVRVLRPMRGQLQFLNVAEAPLSVTADVSADGHITEIPTSLPIRIGDRLGVSFPDQSLHYLKQDSGSLCAWRPEAAVQPIGTTATYTTAGCTAFEVLVAGTVEPDSAFSLARRSRKQGRVRLTVKVSNPGVVRVIDARFQAGGTGAARGIAPRLKPVTAATHGPGRVAVTLKPSKAGRRALSKRGRLRVPIAVSFTPRGGSPRTEVSAVRFRANH